MKERIEMLLEYIRGNTSPVLVDFISGDDLPSAVVLPANIDISELSGHYEGIEYVPPKWFDSLQSSNEKKILVIDKIDTIPKDEQMKFGEILEYRKISTFDLPENCVIVVTANEINSEKISEEVFSLVARI